MKAYQIKIELENSTPLIWRQVAIPAQITFADLHAVIQNSLNFQDQHLFVFDLPAYNLKVTNDDQAYKLHAEYKENKAELEKVLGALNTDFAQNQLAAMRTEVHKPCDLKIDQYLQELGKLAYKYSEEDSWEITIRLEQILKDYGFAYPTLLDGEQAAPPEDVRGLSGFYDFLEVYNDPNHPDHAEALKWAKGKQFREYDANHITSRLKTLTFLDIPKGETEC